MATKGKTSTATNRVSLTISPDILGPGLYYELMSLSKHARSNKMLRLLLVGNVLDKQLLSGRVDGAVELPAELTSKETPPPTQPRPRKRKPVDSQVEVSTPEELGMDGLDGIVAMFRDGISLSVN